MCKDDLQNLQLGQDEATFRWFHRIGGPIASTPQLVVAEQQNLVFCTGNKDTTENIAIEWVYLHTNGVHSLTKQTHTHEHTNTLTHTDTQTRTHTHAHMHLPRQNAQ